MEEAGLRRGETGETGDRSETASRSETGYDELDVLVNRLTGGRRMAIPVRELEPEMVEYYKTPARVVLELAARVPWREGDVFVDLGAGLGQVVLLVHLLTGVPARGVEIEPAYWAYARDSAAKLNLADVSFLHADARDADLSEGTVFFMFTPFKGGLLREVLAALRREATQRKITLITYGPCTAEVAGEDWLKPEREMGRGNYSLTVLHSI